MRLQARPSGLPLEPVEAAQHIAPLGPEGRLPAALVELLAQDERQERAEHVPAGRRVRRVVDRPRAHQRLGRSEQLLHPDQITVSEHRLERRDPGIRAQHEDAVVAHLVGKLADVDLERALASAASTKGATIPSWRRPATMVVVFQ